MIKVTIVIFASFLISGCGSHTAASNEVINEFSALGQDKITVTVTRIDGIKYEVKIESTEAEYKYFVGRPELVDNLFIDNKYIERVDNLVLAAHVIHGESVEPKKPIVAIIQLTPKSTAPHGKIKFKICFYPSNKIVSGDGIDSYSRGNYVYMSNELELSN